MLLPHGKKLKVNAPTLLSKPLGDLIAALTATGKVYIINATDGKIYDTIDLKVLRVSPSIPWVWRGGFLFPTPNAIYYWRDGELYYYRVRGFLLGVFANDRILILATLVQEKLNLTALLAEEVKFNRVLSPGGI